MHKFRIKDPESVGFLLGSLVIFQGVRPSTQNQWPILDIGHCQNETYRL